MIISIWNYCWRWLSHLQSG